MKAIYKETLFDRNCLVAERGKETGHAFEVLYALAEFLGIRIVSGEKLAQEDMIRFASERLGINVPEPFYRGFPESVRKLYSHELLFDQLFHYFTRYGLKQFDTPGHSILESALERSPFREHTEIRDFTILTEEEAEAKLAEIVGNYLVSTRPLNDRQYALVLEHIGDHDGEIPYCASKNTAIRLLADSRDLRFVSFLTMSDVMKLVDEIQYRYYGSEDIRQLNLRNRDRKFITAVIDRLFLERRCDTRTCSEKKALWSGLLHHIHYRPKDELASHFAACMRGRENISVYSEFEKALAERDIKKAVTALREGKSASAVLRNLNYIVSRCRTQEELDFVLDCMDRGNRIVLIQLLLRFANESEGSGLRSFRFTRHNKTKVHYETEEEHAGRRSYIPAAYAERICARIRKELRESLAGRLGKVYIDPAMKKIALPVQENSAQGGYGVLPRGSRLPIAAEKKVRAFTYWERVDDIDLSVIGIDEEGKQTEFSWRTMFNSQSAAITYSGDETSGYEGGSEFFDIDMEAFRQQYPGIRFLIFCDNVFTRGKHFKTCLCKAGYMLRDRDDSGEIYEPQTVQSAYVIDCDSSFAYLFGIDLEADEFVWLNTARSGSAAIAGSTSLRFLMEYFDAASVINMYSFFEMMATELVEDPAEADVVVSDRSVEHAAGAELIRSCDFDKVLALMNA